MCEVVPCEEVYPQVFNLSIPTGYLLTGIDRAIIPMMDKYEIRRQKVMELIENRCGGVHAKFAEKIDRSPSYVGRMLYEEGKKGKKNISDTLIDVIEEKFNLTRGWLDGIGEDETLPANEQTAGLSKEQELAVSIVARMDQETSSAFVALFEKLMPERRTKAVDHNPERRRRPHFGIPNGKRLPGPNVDSTRKRGNK